MVPKIIHQTSKTAKIPEQWRYYQQRVQSLYPNWEYRLWTDEDNLKLVHSYMPDFEKVFISAPLNIMRADLIRYVIMDRYGGVYLDFDYEFLRFFDFEKHHVVLPRESNDDNPISVGNSILGSEAGHPFWRAVLREYTKNINNYTENPEEGDIISLTGPGLLTCVYQRDFVSDQSIYIPPRLFFNPPIPKTPSEYQNLAIDQNIYGIHHCDGTWRALTYPQKIVKRLKRILSHIF